MKKSLIALAALAATASFAQSSVTIDGVMDAGFQAINYKGNSVNGINGNGSSTSQINFRGNFDLGGGLKADFRVETDWNTVSNNANQGAKSTAAAGAATSCTTNALAAVAPVAPATAYTAGTTQATCSATYTDSTLANGSSFGNGEIRTGLAGGFGKVQFGAINNNTLIANLTGQPFGTAIGSGHGAIIRSNAAGTAVRNDNSVQYISPNFSGFDVAYLQSNAQSKAVDSTSVKSTSFSSSMGAYDQAGVKELSVSYANGPLAARFTNLKQQNLAALGAADTTTNTLGANYALGAAKVFLWNQKNSAADNSFNTSGTTVSATYTMGATTLMAQMGSVKSSAGATNGKKSTLTGLGFDYALSKTTFVYGRYEAIDDKAALIAAASTIDGTDSKRTRTALGLRVGF